MDETYRHQVKDLESENEDLRDAVKRATNELELLAEKAEKYSYEKTILENSKELDLEKIRNLEAQSKIHQESIDSITENNSITVKTLQEELDRLRYDYQEKCQQITNVLEMGQDQYLTTGRPQTLVDKCVNTYENSDPSTRFSPILCSSLNQSKLRAEEDKLEDVVHEFQNSVSRMIVSESQSKQDKDRISALEQQLSEVWHEKEVEVQSARTCREEEIRNLRQIIDNLMTNLESEKRRSELLEKGMSDQKVTIQHLQEGLVRTKQDLESSRQKNQTDLDQCGKLVARMVRMLIRTEDEIGKFYTEFDHVQQQVIQLRDENVDLERDLFYNHQDLEMYEMRLAKYQQLYRQLQTQCQSLKMQLETISGDKEEQEEFVEDLNEHLNDCQNELAELFDILVTTTEEQTEKQNQCEQITKMQEDLKTLNSKLSAALKEVQEERKHNSVLSASLMKSQCLCATMKNETLAAHRKLESAASKMSADADRIEGLKQQVQELRNMIAELRQQIEDYEQQLEDKSQHRLQLEEKLSSAQNDFDLEAEHYQITIDELKAKIEMMECNCQKFDDQLIEARKKLRDYEARDMELRDALSDKETHYHTKLNQCQCEQERLIALVKDFEDRLAKTDEEIREKDDLLMDLKKELCEGEQLRQQGAVELKNEINLMIQTQNTLKNENDKLLLQVSQLRTKLALNEEKTKSMMSELEQCLIDLQNVQSDKDFLLTKNEQLAAQLQSLQDLCHTKTESVVNLEMELTDSKSVRDALCSESRHVIENVRSWLQEQRRINVELNERIRHKNEVISKLNQEKRTLQGRIKSLSSTSSRHSSDNSCQRTSSSVGFEPQNQQHYPVQVIQSPALMTSNSSSCRTPLTNNCWSLGSLESPACSLNEDSDWENEQLFEDPPHVWVHRVESLTEELQRSNRYWKSKMDTDYPQVTRDK